MADVTLVTGGAGYIGAVLTRQLHGAGRRVRVLDAVIHGQEQVAADLEGLGVEVVRGDVRDAAAREAALVDVGSVVHLSAIVGDPACSRDPALSTAVNVDATMALLDDLQSHGVGRFIFASTCSNYGRVSDPDVLVTEESPLAPVSLYAEQKVAVETELLNGRWGGVRATCLRFATVYGAAPRMRFDLTVNEFTRELWAGKELLVFGEQFWRPYIHVNDVAAAVAVVLDQPTDRIGGAVYNVGSTEENYRKLDIVEVVQSQVPRGSVSYVRRDEDPRDYRVNFDKIARELGFRPRTTVADGVREIAAALDEGAFDDPYASRYTNTP
jgi:nucleoside-diphosphate-sugar epimerase